MLRESWLVLWTQPLLIRFQFFGRRLGSGGGVVPVVLVHGYFQNRVDFLYLHATACGGLGPPLRVQLLLAAVAGKLLCQRRGLRCEGMRGDRGDRRRLGHTLHRRAFALDLIAEQPHVVRRAALIALPARGVPGADPSSASQVRSCVPDRCTTPSGRPRSRNAGDLDLLGARQHRSSRADIAPRGAVGHQRRDLRPRPPRGSVRPPSRRRGVRLPSRPAPIVPARYRRAGAGMTHGDARRCSLEGGGTRHGQVRER